MIMSDRKALLVLDLINEIAHPKGGYAQEGYFNQISKRKVLENTAKAISQARENKIPVIYVIVGFSENYVECPINSPVFNLAKKEGLLKLNMWGTQVHKLIKPKEKDIMIVKNRISPFYQTNLNLILGQLNIDTLLLTGVSTEFVIFSTVSDAHDRDYKVIVLEDATAASGKDRHEAAIKLLSRRAEILSVDEFFSK